MPDTQGPAPIIVFDGVCNLCHAAVRFVLAHDRDAVFRFASAESETGLSLVAAGGSEEQAADSLILVESGALFLRSDAVLRIAARLGYPWRTLVVLRLVPRPIRDAAYDFLARNRYRWFGRKESCPAPDPASRSRYLP
jgi:predicted DCC family thiol-disulfide oxidoreductase YuxK